MSDNAYNKLAVTVEATMEVTGVQEVIRVIDIH